MAEHSLESGGEPSSWTRLRDNWGWLLVSGLLSLIAGVLIWIGWPSSAAWALGLLVGIELIFGGWSMILLALAARWGTGAT